MEEWLTNKKIRADVDVVDNESDVFGMLDRTEILDEFDSFLVRTVEFLGGFTRTAAEPVEELVME